MIVFFTACSSKKVYEPKSVKAHWPHYGQSNDTIIDISTESALLDSRKVLAKDKLIENITIEESYRLVGNSDGWVISANIDGNLSLQFIADATMQEKFELKKTVAGASVKDDVLAVLFADNEMALYSISSKELLLKEQGNPAIAVDAKIVNTFFMNDLVLFLTLDGKIVIINAQEKKKLRTVIVSSESNFNSIIYFNVVEGRLIAATGYKLLSMAKQELRESYEIRNVVYDNKNLYIATRQGEIISLTSDLQVNAKLKFPFAHFLGLIAHNDKIYALEKEGYLIEMSQDLLTYDIYEVNVNKGYVFVADKKFYVDDEYITIE